MEKYIFLEREGVITVRQDEPVRSPEEIAVLAMVPEALTAMMQHGMKAIIFACNDSNLPMSEANRLTEATYAALEDFTSPIEVTWVGNDEIINGESMFPNPKVLQAFAQKYRFDLKNAWYISSRIECLRSAWTAGCKSAFMRTGKPFRTLQALQNSKNEPNLVSNDILEVVIHTARS